MADNSGIHTIKIIESSHFKKCVVSKGLEKDILDSPKDLTTLDQAVKNRDLFIGDLVQVEVLDGPESLRTFRCLPIPIMNKVRKRKTPIGCGCANIQAPFFPPSRRCHDEKSEYFISFHFH